MVMVSTDLMGITVCTDAKVRVRYKLNGWVNRRVSTDLMGIKVCTDAKGLKCGISIRKVEWLRSIDRSV